jgi:tRNA pseudouridine38-40 synthase
VRYFIQLSYKGSHYAGWQIQENAITVQEKVNEALATVLQQAIETVGCGRTDTGVHARNFYAHFETEHPLTDKEELLYRLNRLLPKDIAVYDLMPVNPDAHARFHAVKRSYEYHITRLKDPFETDTAYHFSGELNVEAMNKAATLLFTYTDFTSFSKSHTQTKTNNCKIYRAEWLLQEGKLIFHISADRFLRNMVRAIVGTLLEVGKGKVSENEFKSIIESMDRKKAGMSVPAEGLFLVEVEYPGQIFIV